MWRLWTRGWGVRAWWDWFYRDGWPLWVACHLPPRIVYWAFIRVHARDGQNPGEDFNRAAKGWAAAYGLDTWRHR